MSPYDDAGDPPCWAHLFDAEAECPAVDANTDSGRLLERPPTHPTHPTLAAALLMFGVVLLIFVVSALGALGR